MFGCVKFVILFFCCFISFGSAEYAYIEETNTHQLDMDSFWAIAHKIDKHVIIELYTSAAWCSKNNYWARPCEKTDPKKRWFKPVVSENKSLVRKN